MTMLIKDIPFGALVRDKTALYKGNPVVWRVVDKNHQGYPANTVVLVADRSLGDKKFDGSSNDYMESDLLAWLNSESNYNSVYRESGFLYGFSKEFKNALINVRLSNNKGRRSGGKWVDVYLNQTVNLPTFAELGKNVGEPNSGVIYKFTGISEKKPAWTRQAYPGDLFIIGINAGNDYTIEVDNQIGVLPFVCVKNDIKISDGPVNGVYEIIWNQPPSKPTSFSLPEKAISRSETEISWTKSTDPENDPISYKLERSLDGGDFVERYKGSFTRYKDIIEDKGHKSVVYRVTAIDSYGNQSESLTSASIPVSDNTIPSIETASVDLGKITAAYSVSYKVVDPDEGQTWTVTESLDGKVLKTFNAKVGTSYTSKMTPSDWQKVLNGKHVLKIEVVDSDGGKSAKEISFEKAVNKLDFMLAKAGLQGIDKMPERAILSMSANVPSGASIKIEITNNALDDKPVWQDCTAQVLGNEKIFFSNKTKTATKWAVNVRVTGDKKTATEVLSVSIIGGFYD